MEAQEIVNRGATLYGEIEKALDETRLNISELETLYKVAASQRLIKGAEALKTSTRLGVIAGKIAAVENEIYDLHTAATKEAKSQNLDTPTGFVTIASGGDR